MSSAQTSSFVSRFDRIWAQARRVQLSQSLCWGVLTALAGVALLAAVDYWWELPRLARMAALVATGLAAIAVAVMLSIQSFRRWQRQATAAAIEQVFPQLGQRIRTTVQYGVLSSGQIESEGVATTLVGALEADTVKRAQPLPLDAVVPWKSLALASMLAAVVGLGLAGASALDWEWRAAAQRAFLGEEPYTKITVDPGNLTLKEGESSVIHATVEGRIGKQVTVWTRQTDEAGSQWEAEVLSADDAEQKDDRTLVFEHGFDRVRHPLEYRIAAGSGTSPTYRVDVLYPLKIAKIQATMQAPEYTGLKEQVVEGGNITGLAGTQVKFAIELDREAQEAWLELTSVGRRTAEGPELAKLPLTIEGKNMTASFELAADQKMSVVAKAADGMELPENVFRIRVRKDEAPQVWFESPSEALEVHSLVELLMRIRVSDDFGLSRAGIMFEVNNEEEYPLLAQDFQAAAEELKTTGKISPQTRATLEKMLPLEHFQLTPQDSVMYYAFAEDNKPENPQRTESDLRFVDIRAFKRQYRLLDSEDGMPPDGNRPQLKSLDELIARQRYALNRTMQLEKRFKHTQEADLAGTDAMIKFEGELAKFTRELAEGLEARGVDPSDTELLYQAETSMLGATDSLSAGNYETAVLQQRDAVKYLIEGRNKIQEFISKNPNRQQLAQLRNFDRTQRQKLRKPKTDEEEAKEVARRLEQLADEEDFVYKTLAGIPTAGTSKGESDSQEATASNEQPMKPNEKGQKGDMPPAKAKDGEKAKDGDKGQEAEKGEKGDKGKDAEKGDKGQEAEKGKNGETAKGEKGEQGKGEKGDQPGSGKGQAPSPQELEDKQLDIAVEAREIEKILNRLNGVTDLTKERIGAAAKTAEEAGTALGQGNMKDAENAAKTAGGQFRELNEQVKALLAEEQADRVGAAQQMAADLSRQQQDFVDRLADKSEQSGGAGDPMPKKDNEKEKPGKGEKGKNDKPQQNQPGLGGQAEKIAERAKTLADVLGAAAGANNPEDQATAEKVKELMGSIGLPDLTQRLQQLPDQVAGGKTEEAKANAGDGAERMEAAAQQLAALHRAIVAPKVDELAKAEEKLTVLDEELDTLETPTAITGWHVDATALLDELDKLGISKELRDQLLDEMKKAGWSPDVVSRGWRWNRIEGGYYAAPGPYRVLISRLSSDIRSRMQELMLGELAFGSDEPIPPQYQELVDRYYQVLASEGKEQPKRPAITPQK
ncbi:MAG TPA: hypothetical protein VFB96_20875 [Pirellulaceae bacterium]|nr:hypothetical protein [Pirellulaceae bacterium]